LQEGVVVRIDRKQIHVNVGGRLLPCTVRGRFFEDAGDDPESRPVAVGDRVKVELEADGEHGAIEEVLPRTSRIARPRPRDPQRFQVIAANVDLLVIVSSLAQPRPKPGLIDRLLVAAESEHIEPLIVLNKVDLVADVAAEEFGAPYRALGYPVVATSVVDGRGVEEVRQAMRGRLAMLLGHSGVGKSSLLRALDPTIEARIGALIGEGTRSVRGAHTTTSASLHDLDLGHGTRAFLVDTPGVREFGLEGLVPADLGHFFREFVPHLGKCRYATCTHDHEPSCGVKAALESGAIRKERYDTYKKLLAELSGEGERMQRHDSY
jgi:ribosome biogenesis GTPase